MDNLIQQATEIYEKAQGFDGATIFDGDTILADIMEKNEFDFEIFPDLVGIYKNSNDKSAVAQMFYEFTGVEFEDYLQRCIDETSQTGTIGLDSEAKDMSAAKENVNESHEDMGKEKEGR